MSRFGLKSRRSLGQHFMTDPETVRRIAWLSGVGPGDHVVEIGAGLGSLTLALIETGASVLAVEIDARLIPVLRHVIAKASNQQPSHTPAAAPPYSSPSPAGTGASNERPSHTPAPAGLMLEGIPENQTADQTNNGRTKHSETKHGDAATGVPQTRIVEGDARLIDFQALLSTAERWHLVANLPYNIATSLVIDLLNGVAAIETMLVVLQRETAERLAAPPGSRARGIPSVLVERCGIASVLGTLPPSVFTPRPAVESAILHIKRHSSLPGTAASPKQIQASKSPDASGCADSSEPVRPPDQPIGSEDRLAVLLRTAFGQRRKMLRRSLVGIVKPDAFAAANVDPSTRPEMLTFRQWSKLAAVPSHEHRAGEC